MICQGRKCCCGEVASSSSFGRQLSREGTRGVSGIMTGGVGRRVVVLQEEFENTAHLCSCEVGNQAEHPAQHSNRQVESPHLRPVPSLDEGCEDLDVILPFASNKSLEAQQVCWTTEYQYRSSWEAGMKVGFNRNEWKVAFWGLEN